MNEQVLYLIASKLPKQPSSISARRTSKQFKRVINNSRLKNGVRFNKWDKTKDWSKKPLYFFMDVVEGRGSGFTRSIPETPWGPSGKEITVKILNAPTVVTSTVDMIKKAPAFGSLPRNSQEQLERFMHNRSYTGTKKWYMNRY